MTTKKQMAATIAGLRVQSETSGLWREKFMAADKACNKARAELASLAGSLKRSQQTNDRMAGALQKSETEILRQAAVIEKLKADAAKLVAENVELQGDLRTSIVGGQKANQENARLRKELAAKPKTKVVDNSADVAGLKAEIDRLQRELAAK